MAVVNLNIPDRLRDEAEKLAKGQNLSLNEFLIWIITEKVARLSTMSEANRMKSARERWTRVAMISLDGVKVLIQDEEKAYLYLFVPFSQYPQLLRATLEEVFDVDNHIPGMLSWPQLSLNISMENLVYPGDLF